MFHLYIQKVLEMHEFGHFKAKNIEDCDCLKEILYGILKIILVVAFLRDLMLNFLRTYDKLWKRFCVFANKCGGEIYTYGIICLDTSLTFGSNQSLVWSIEYLSINK